MNTKVFVLGLATLAVVLIAYAMTLEKIDDPTRVEFSPTEGFIVETNVGTVAIPQNIRDTDEAKTYPIGDTVINNTIVSNSYGFVISAPNDSWNVKYLPKDIDFGIDEITTLAFMHRQSGERLETISIDKWIDWDLDFEKSVKIFTNNAKDRGGTNFQQYDLNEYNARVMSYNFHNCSDKGCFNHLQVDVYRKIGTDLYILSGTIMEPDDKPTVNAISSDMSKVMNSFKFI